MSTFKNQILGNYLFRFLQSSFANAYFETCAHGVTRFGLGKDSIGNITITLPSITEQNQIADFLNTQTVKIDSIIQKTHTPIRHLQEFRKAIVTAVVTGKIDVRNFSN